MSDITSQLRTELRDLEYADGYAESFLNSYIATQIKVLREQRKMKQSELAREMGTTQTGISRIENVNYSAWNIRTLKKLAKAFRVRLHVSFETYGSLLDDVERFNRHSLERDEHKDDFRIWAGVINPATRIEEHNTGELSRQMDSSNVGPLSLVTANSAIPRIPPASSSASMAAYGATGGTR